MTADEEMIERFRDRGILRGKELFLTPSTALEFLEACEENDLAILGIDTFLFKEEGIQILMDWIADYSLPEWTNWEECRSECYTSGKKFLADLPKKEGIRVSIVVLSQEELRAMKKNEK